MEQSKPPHTILQTFTLMKVVLCLESEVSVISLQTMPTSSMLEKPLENSMSVSFLQQFFQHETLYASPVRNEKVQQVEVSSEEVPLFENKILILVEKLNEEDRSLLANILRSVGHSLEDIDLLETEEHQDFKRAFKGKTAHYFLSFGVPLHKIGIEIPLLPYQVRAIDGLNFMLADKLSDLHEDKTKKKVLWHGLRAMFGLT